jgi:ATP-dependent RNA helicase RhlE
MGCAQTGTGKTAAFALPILQHLAANTSQNGKSKRPIRALVLSPTRELAAQIGDSFQAYGRHIGTRYATIYGGVSPKPQIEKLKRGVDVLVATPGRLLDLMNQGFIRQDRLEILVLDEADRMLDMGFLPDVRRIIKALPTRRQTLLFSATIPADIQDLANSILTDPVHIEVTPEKITVDAIEQKVYFVEKKQKRALLVHLLKNDDVTRALVFTRTKHQANRLTQQLDKKKIRAEAIHGNKSQGARERALGNFKRGTTRVLVATDIAARGIDVDDISHVINYELPNETESYVHRIGRTGRAGAGGKAFSFCSTDERDYLTDIERLIRMHITVVTDHPFNSEHGIPAPTDLNPPQRGSSKSRRSGGKSGSRNGKSANGKSSGNGNNNGSRNSRSRRNRRYRKSASPTN